MTPPPPLPRDEPKRPQRMPQRVARPARPITRMPKMIAETRTFMRMSPFRMWLNSCATTPWSSSRLSFWSVPRVTVTTASLDVSPAAKELIAGSSSRM